MKNENQKNNFNDQNLEFLSKTYASIAMTLKCSRKYVEKIAKGDSPVASPLSKRIFAMLKEFNVVIEKFNE